MVRSKEVPKKPKDPLLMTPPPSKPRGGFLEEGRPWSRGGAAVSTTPASVPNYMRATSSSDAKAGPGRRGRSAVSSASASASPARRRPAVRVVTRGKVLFPEVPGSGSGSGPGLGRATCSSTLKEAKYPAALDLAPGATDAEGPAAMRVCPYTYCSLNGHVHAPAVPLRSFLASRRRLIKTQQSMKLKGVSAFRKKSADKNGDGGGVKAAPLIDEEAAGDFFVEVYAGPRVSSDMSCSDMSLDEMDATVRRMEFVVFDRRGVEEDDEEGKDLATCDDAEPHPRLEEKHGACRDSSSECSDAAISGFVEELPWMRYHGYEYDSMDDEISEVQRARHEEDAGAGISTEQEDKNEDRTSVDDCEKDAAEGQEATGEEDISDLSPRVMEEMDGRDEDNILDEQRAAEERLSDDVCKSEIPDQVVAETERVDSVLEESSKEVVTSVDRGTKDDECSGESDGESEVPEDQNLKGERTSPDYSSEIEISEEAISGDACREDFSEVTSRDAPEDNAFELYVSTEGVKDGRKDSESTTYILEEASEESCIVQESNPDDISTCVYDDMESEFTPCKSKDALKGSVVTQESNLNDNDTADCDSESAEVEPENTTGVLEDASEETCIDQRAVEDYETASIGGEAQNDLEFTECKSSVTTQEADHDGRCVDVSSDSQNDSELATSKLTVTSISGHTEDESDLTTWKSDGVSEDFVVQEAGRGDSSTTTDGIQTESDVTICESEGAQQESDLVNKENKDNSADAEKETKTAVYESEGASEEPAMLQEVDEHVNTIDASEFTQLDIVIPKSDASEDVHITEEATEPSNVPFLQQQCDLTAEGHAEPHNIQVESTDANEPSIDDICDAFSGMNLKGHVYFDPAESAMCPRNKLIISRRRRTPEEEEYFRGFNPRAPNFLPLELDPDAEKVDLRHQMMDERKNAEEWMIDYALRRAVTNLAPARKKKVELLVQAFETVLPHDLDDKKSMTPTTHVQACN